MIRYWWLALVILGVGVLIGRASAPTVDTVRADSLVVTQPGHDSGRADVRDSVALEKERADAAEAEARRLSRVVLGSQRSADRLGTRADSLQTALKSTTSRADSLPLLVEQIGALREERDTLRAIVGSLAVARDSALSGMARLRVAVGRLEDQVTRDSVRLEVYQSVVDGLRRAHSGCRVPLTKIKCPQLSVTWGVDSLSLMPRNVNAIYPVTDWFGLGISKRLQ